MLFGFDDILKDDYCRGVLEPKIDDEWRLRLPKEAADMLEEHGVTELYRCPDPTGARFILCPAEHWKTFVDAVKKQFQESPKSDQAWRLLCAATPAAIDSQNRIRITKICLDHAKLGPGKRVNMLGIGKWYEISSHNKEAPDK